MRVRAYNYSDSRGGAAQAALRIHHAVRAAGIDSTLHVVDATHAETGVAGPRSLAEKAAQILRAQVAAAATRYIRTPESPVHTLAVMPSGRGARLDRSDADVAHLHWVGNEMFSVREIGRISTPLVWTLHDMWAFCGAEHLTTGDRYREGYRRDNRPPGERGPDLNRWTWNRKRRAWRRPIQIVAPSRWLGDCVRESVLMRDWPVAVIPNAIDLDTWKPVDRTAARRLLDLPEDRRIVAFGSMHGNAQPLKGADLLMAALNLLRGQIPDLMLLVFGQAPPRDPPDLGFPVRYLGVLRDQLSLRVMYSAADAVAIPSRQENLPNTGLESAACGTPVVGFRTCGLPDIVEERRTGWLAEPFDPEDLARGIAWILEDEGRSAELGRAARGYAEEHWSAPRVAQRYLTLYTELLERSGAA